MPVIPRAEPYPGGRWDRRQRTTAVLVIAALLAAILTGCGHSSTPRSAAPPTSAPATTTGPGTTVKPPSSAPGRPNIVFILTDDLSDNLLTPQFMPNLWGLAHDGTSFSRYFVTDSLCCPSRASIFTGRYPHDTGVFSNSGPQGGFNIFNARGDQSSTLATDLHQAGYRTAMMGKYLNQYEPNDAPAPGWDQWDVTGNGGYNEFNYVINENGHMVSYGGPGGSRDNYLTDVLSGLANGFVQSSTAAAQPSPFFLEVATYAPHAPYIPAPRYARLYKDLPYPRTPAYGRANTDAPKWLKSIPPLTRAAEANMDEAYRLRAESVKSVDDMIGRLVTTLKARGVWNNTYLVFSSDNGYHMGEHNLRAGKLTAFDTDINVPLLIVGPHVAPGRVVNAFTGNIDLRPTFDQWAGTTPSEAIDGRSLQPVLNDPTTPPRWPQGILVEHRGPVLAPSDPDYPPVYSGNPDSYEALRFSDGLYVEYENGQREYYDLTDDPYELHNIYTRLSPGYVAELHTELTRVKTCRDAPACSDIIAPVGAPG